MHAIALTAALSLIQPAHSWYPYACCGELDCHAVDDVSEVPGGYRVEGVFVEKWRAQPSQDAHYHMCRSGERVLCFFAPMNM